MLEPQFVLIFDCLDNLHLLGVPDGDITVGCHGEHLELRVIEVQAGHFLVLVSVIQTLERQGGAVCDSDDALDTAESYEVQSRGVVHEVDCD